MTTQTLWLQSGDDSTLFDSDGTSVDELADGSSSPVFPSNSIFSDMPISVTYIGSTAYIIMDDTVGTTGSNAAIWQYNGTTLTQITSSTNYVNDAIDPGDPTEQAPFVVFNNELVFSQGSLASNAAGDDTYDTATLSVYNPGGAITPFTAPNGGYNPHDFVTLGTTLYYEAADSSTGAPAIYAFNGTSVTEVYNLHPTNTGGAASGAAAPGYVAGSLIAFNGNLYFGSGDQSIEELTSTGSLSNAATDVTPDQTLPDSYPIGNTFIVSGDYLFFDLPLDGVYSLSTSGTLTQVLANASYYTPVVYNGVLYFTAAPNGTPVGERNFYSTTGGKANLVQADFNGSNFLVMGSTLYFGTSSGAGTYNGSTFGTLSVPGGAEADPAAVLPFAATSWTAAANAIAVNAGGSATYGSGGPAVTLDPGLTLTDTPGSTLTSATVAIGNVDFVYGDMLYFTDQNGITGSYDPNAGELTLNGTASVAQYQAALDSITYNFTQGDSTNGGLNFSRTIYWTVGDGTDNAIAATSTLTTLCFCTGTMIATPDGEIEVARLAAGDKVLTASGAVRAVTWAGAGRVLATRGRRGPATPVIVRKGALADNVPHTDMRVTKGHALFLDNVLVPVEFLINHQSILWDDHAQEVSLRHIELEAHDVLLANGAPAESYRDDGNRWLFHNANEGWDLPPQEPCAPVLTGGPVVDRIWRRLLDRCGQHRRPPLTDDADLHLLVDRRRVDASKRDGRTHVFRVPKGAVDVRIVSRDAVPAELGLARDFRSLGVALQWIELGQGPKVTRIEADDDRLVDGFHMYEPDGNLRWTDGDARLPAALISGFRRDTDVVVYVAATTRYPLLGGAANQAAA